MNGAQQLYPFCVSHLLTPYYVVVCLICYYRFYSQSLMLQKSTGIYFSQDNGHNVFAINYCFMFSRKQLTAVVQAANLLVMDKSNLKVALVHVRI